MDAVIDAWVDMVEAEAESEGDETAEPKQDARNSDRVAGVAGVGINFGCDAFTGILFLRALRLA